MGEKGARLTGTAVEVAEQFLDELPAIADLSSRKMFGGVGVFAEGKMFAIVDSGGCLFLRADETTSRDFEAGGGHKHGRMPYWSVPNTVLSKPDELPRWAARAVEVARNH